MHICRIHKSLRGQLPIEVFLHRPNCSLYAQPARQDLTTEECDFLDNAHLDVEATSGDEDCNVDVDTSSEDTESLADGEVNCITEDEPVPRLAGNEPDNCPVEVQWTMEAKFDIGEPVWFYRAANLAGAAGVAALRPQWREGVVIEFVAEDGGFPPYKVRMEDDFCTATVSAAHVKPQHVPPSLPIVCQWLEPMPKNWARGPEPCHKRLRR